MPFNCFSKGLSFGVLLILLVTVFSCTSASTSETDWKLLSPNGLYTIRFPEPEETYGQASHFPSSSLPWQTPWRVAIIGDEAGDLVESTLIIDLAPPSVLDDTSWIRPGRSSWSWWSDHPSSKDFVKLKSFIDLAAEMDWEYSLVDANWNTMEGGDIEQLLAYAKEMALDLSFLEKESMEAIMVMDAANPRAFKVETGPKNTGETMAVSVMPSGGFFLKLE